MFGRLQGNPLHLVLPRLIPFVVVEVSGVVAELVDVGCHDLREPVILLQVHAEVGVGFGGDIDNREGIGGAVDGDPHHIGSGPFEVADLSGGGGDVAGRGGRHALHGDR